MSPIRRGGGGRSTPLPLKKNLLFSRQNINNIQQSIKILFLIHFFSVSSPPSLSTDSNEILIKKGEIFVLYPKWAEGGGGQILCNMSPKKSNFFRPSLSIPLSQSTCVFVASKYEK